MSNPRFAPITSSLLARKGDAMPSAVAAKPSLFWARETPPPPAPAARLDAPHTAPLPPDPPDTAKPHRMMVTLSASEFEKLGIAAVKKGLTRQQVLRVGLDAHLERLKREYGGCGCMAMGGGGCTDGCGAG
jgi:hypothetical protein